MDWATGTPIPWLTILQSCRRTSPFAAGSFLGIDSSDGSFTYGGTISGGSLGLHVLGDNTLTVTGINTYTGGTTVISGTLEAQSPSALPGYASGQVAVENGATLAVAVGGPNDWNSSEDNIASLLGPTFDVGSWLGIDTSDGNFTYSGTLSGNQGLTILGSNTLTLDPADGNSYQGGTDVAAGTLEVDSSAALPGSGVVSVADGATLTLLVGDGWNQSAVLALLGNGTPANPGSVTFASGSALAFDTSAATGGFSYGDTIAGPENVAVLGGHALTLDPGPAGNTYTGTTTVSAGTLDVDTPAALPGYDASGDVSVAANATLAVMVGGSGWNSDGLDDIAALLSNADFAGGAWLGIDTGNAGSGFTYAGTIVDTSGGSLGLDVFGGNTLELLGASTYSGPTAIGQNTTLEMGADDALPSTTVVTLGNGASLNLNELPQDIAGLASPATGPSGCVNMDDAQLTLDTSVSQSYGGTLCGDAAEYGSPGSKLIVTGSGIQTLTGNNGYNGVAGSDYCGTIEVTSAQLSTREASTPWAAPGGCPKTTNTTISAT